MSLGDATLWYNRFKDTGVVWYEREIWNLDVSYGTKRVRYYRGGFIMEYGNIPGNAPKAKEMQDFVAG